MELQVLSAQELLRLCLQSPDSASWDEFVCRFQPLIARVITRTLTRWTKPESSLVDDLVHDTYVKLFVNNCKALREFHCDHENSLFGFLKTVASNVVYDYIRRKRAPVHGGGLEAVDLENVSPFLPASCTNADRQVLVNQILGCLRKLKDEPNFQRDWAIFQLYFFHGLTAKAISELPGIDLNVKGVESVLMRLVRYVRGELNGNEEDDE